MATAQAGERIGENAGDNATGDVNAAPFAGARFGRLFVAYIAARHFARAGGSRTIDRTRVPGRPEYRRLAFAAIRRARAVQ